MLFLNNFSHKTRRILAIVFLGLLMITLSSCKGTTVDSVKFDDTYLKVKNVTITNGDLWNEIKWNAADLFDQKATETVLDSQLTKVREVMSNKEHEDYNNYKARLENYLIEAVFGFEFSLEDHDEEIENLAENDRETKIRAYAGNTIKQYEIKVDGKILTTTNIENALTSLVNPNVTTLTQSNEAVINALYEIYYIDLAKELLAYEKLEEEIKEKNKEAEEDDDEDTIGYFSKSEIVTQYKDEHLYHGDTTAVVIEFASQKEANDMLMSFGIKEYLGELYYLDYLLDMDYETYKYEYQKLDMADVIDADDKEISKVSSYTQDAILQLYIAMYNYIYTYHSDANRLKNYTFETGDLDATISGNKTSDQRKVFDLIRADANENADISEIEENIKTIVNAQSEGGKKALTKSADDLIEKNKSLYDYIYKDLEEVLDTDVTNYTLIPESLGEKYYMVYKIDYKENESVDSLYEEDITDDDLYDKIVKKQDLYDEIIKELTDKKITSTYISEKIDEELKDVKVRIFDKDIEIGYSVNHEGYNKTLSKGPDNNTLAEFEYNGVKKYFYLTTEDKTGAWDILEYRNGTTTSLELVTREMIKETQEYKDIEQDDIDSYYRTIEYVLATFANDGFAQAGYPSEIGKYNFLKLYYHSADVDEIVRDYFMVENVRSQILSNYQDETLLNFFQKYVQKSYDNYFSISASQLKVTLDTNDDGKPEEMSDDVKAKAEELIKLVYKRLAAMSGTHSDNLKTIVDTYNATGRHKPGETPDTNPIGSEWLYADYRSIGLVLTIEEVQVTNTTLDKDIKIKNYLNDVYTTYNFADGYNYTQLLLDPNDSTNIIETDKTLNYFIITGAEAKPSAKYESYKDTDQLYENIHYLYNNELIIIDNIYNEEDIISFNQMKAYMYEYLASQTSDLLPSDIQTALTTFFNPVLTRYQSEASQVIIQLNYVADGDVNKLEFANQDTKTRFIAFKEINEAAADNYAKYEEEDKYNSFVGWFDELNKISSKEAN